MVTSDDSPGVVHRTWKSTSPTGYSNDGSCAANDPSAKATFSVIKVHPPEASIVV